MNRIARAFWLSRPGLGEIRSVDLPEPEEGEVLVRSLFPESAAERRRSSSAAAFRRVSTRPCGRRSRRASSPHP